MIYPGAVLEVISEKVHVCGCGEPRWIERTIDMGPAMEEGKRILGVHFERVQCRCRPRITGMPE